MITMMCELAYSSYIHVQISTTKTRLLMSNYLCIFVPLAYFLKLFTPKSGMWQYPTTPMTPIQPWQYPTTPMTWLCTVIVINFSTVIYDTLSLSSFFCKDKELRCRRSFPASLSLVAFYFSISFFKHSSILLM